MTEVRKGKDGGIGVGEWWSGVAAAVVVVVNGKDGGGMAVMAVMALAVRLGKDRG